jgi:hypothetical protein
MTSKPSILTLDSSLRKEFFSLAFLVPMNVTGLMNIIPGRCSVGGVGHAHAIDFAAHGMRVFATARSTKSLSILEVY